LKILDFVTEFSLKLSTLDEDFFSHHIYLKRKKVVAPYSLNGWSNEIWFKKVGRVFPCNFNIQDLAFYLALRLMGEKMETLVKRYET